MKYQAIIAWALVIMLFAGGCGLRRNTAEPGDGDLTGGKDAGEKTGQMEETLVGLVQGGFFYTPAAGTADEDEARYLALRGRSTALLAGTMEDLANDAFAMLDGFAAYEDVLLAALDEITDDPHGAAPLIIEGILARETAMRSARGQILAFREAKPADGTAAAVLNRYLWETTCGLVGLERDYLPWLLGSTEVAVLLLQRTDENMAAGVISACTAAYGELIKPFLQVLNSYYGAAAIYTHILSADYYWGEHLLDQAGNKLSAMDPSSPVYEDAGRFYGEILAQARKPSILLDAPVGPGLAAGIAGPAPLLLASARRDNGGDADFERALFVLNMLSDETSYLGEDLRVYLLMLGCEIIDGENTNALRDSYDAMIDQAGMDIRQTIAQNNDLSAAVEDPPEPIKTMEAQAASMEGTANPGLDRDALLAIIAGAQSSLSTAGLMFGSDNQYLLMITLLNAIIRENQMMDGDRIQKLNDLLTNDLEQILGDKKEQFMDRITQMEAEELLDTFTLWAEHTSNFADLSITKDDMITLLNVLGVYIPLEPVTLEDPVERWQGTVRYTRRIDEFENGALYDTPIGNDFSGDFILTIKQEGGSPVCTVEKVMTYDISNLQVTKYAVEGNQVTLVLEGSISYGNGDVFVWEGILGDDGKSMAGTCFYQCAFSDEFLEKLDRPAGFVRQTMYIIEGTWELDRN